ncbi:hypothetical protein [Scrofimicrobium canadense]|nr:hypothetical protein [Scrofimicrobium canadense]
MKSSTNPAPQSAMKHGFQLFGLLFASVVGMASLSVLSLFADDIS